MVKLIGLYCIFIVIDITYNLVTGVCRTLNLVAFCANTFAIFSVGTNICTNWILYKYFQPNCDIYFVGVFVNFLTAISVCLARLIVLDWKTVELDALTIPH